MTILEVVEDEKFNDGKTLSPFCQVYIEKIIDGEPKRVKWGSVDRVLYQSLRTHILSGERSVPAERP